MTLSCPNPFHLILNFLWVIFVVDSGEGKEDSIVLFSYY